MSRRLKFIRSHGNTEADEFPEGYTVEDAAQDVLSFMDTLNLPPSHFVAMDYGSPIALNIAITDPDRVQSLFIISHTCEEEPPDAREGYQELYESWCSSILGPTEVDFERMKETGYGFAQFMFSNKVSKLGQAMSDISFPLAQKHWGFHGLKNYRIGFLDFLLNRRSNTTNALSCIKCPVQLVYGTDDIAYTQKYTEDFLQALKQAGVDTSLLIVPGAPHFVVVDFSEHIDPALHDFIMKNESRTVPDITYEVVSPWQKKFESVGWDPEGLYDSDDDLLFSYPLQDSN
ncbi:hypothetical protein D9757_014529 [Collybiopsis confluens]|uniref:AB hydrolase-1 domain-containing protein n=1 Tax=Collybiopsis confluens TaxID=2823264 RepID=A0A8H5FNU8_9AGAR|nr:hypothetical protein D9757_014529 [Collybiopsis confluens]